MVEDRPNGIDVAEIGKEKDLGPVFRRDVDVANYAVRDRGP